MPASVMLTPGISCQAPQGGSIGGLGSDLQSFGINDLELVDQTGASWNRTRAWLASIAGLQEMIAG